MAPLAEAYVRVRPDLTTFQRDTEKGVSGAGLPRLGDQHGQAFGKAFGSRAGTEAGSSLAAKFSTFGAKLGPGLLAAFGVGAVKEAFDKIIGGASDLNETVSKSQQVFKGSAGEILQWSKTSASAMGLSQRAALDGASSFENLFSQIGLTGDVSVKMSKNLVQLSSDFASFHNANPEEVMDALLSATRGEYDALQRFVPTVSAAAIQTRALADTGKATAAALTDAEKATALYEIVTEGAGAAVGDFARTSGGAANQQRILTANIENTAASVGNVLLPAYSGVLRAVNDIGPGTVVAAAGVALLSNRLAASGAGAGVFKDLKAAQDLYSETVAAGTPRISAAFETAKAGLTGLRSVGSSVVGLFGGPWGLALTAATVGVGLLTQKMSQSRAETEQAVGAYVRFGEAVQQATSADQVRNLIKQDEALQKLVIEANRFDISARTVTDALAGQGAAVDAVNDALGRRRDELVKTIAEHTRQGGRSGAVMDEQALKARAEVQEIDRLTGSFGAAAEKQRQAAEASGLYTDASQKSRDEAAKNAAAQAEQAAAAGRLSALVKELGANYAPLGPLVAGLSERTKDGAALADVYATSIKGIGQAAIPGSDALAQYRIVADSVGSAHLNAGQRAGEFRAVLDGVTATAGASGPTMQTLGQVFSNIAAAELTASDRAALLKQTWEAMYQPAINQTDATEAFNLSLFTLKDQIDKSSTSLDINNAAGIRNRDTVQALIQRNNDLYFANIAAGMSAEQAGRQHADNALKIEDAGRKAGLSTGDVRGLNEEYGRIPPKKETVVTITGADAVYRQLIDLKIAQLALSQGIDVGQARKEINNQMGRSIGGLATGGPVFGPGTGTSDSIPAIGPGGARYRLSNDEHVWTAAEVKAAGGHAAVELLRKIVLRGRSPRVRRPGDGSEGIAFAGGGAVGGAVWPFPVTASKTKIPAVPLVGAALDAQAFIRAQAGKPYIWASAGPYGYDCSGIVSAVWNLLHGRNPYSHTFSTMNEAGYFPLSGPGLFTAAWANAGERGGGSVGHTAAKLGGLMFESRGGAGVVVGSGVTPLSSFAHIGHYDMGGPLKPGWNAMYNGTGRDEHLRPTGEPVRLDDWTIARLAQALSARPVQIVFSGGDLGIGVAGVAR